jgi:2',3'-cyclic-nucleotide 2'-phosphodiesterase (5'-nucleotidase family)
MPKGAITRGKVFEIMPFENELVVVTLSVEQTVQLFEYIAVKTVKNGTRKQGVPVSGNVLVEILDKTPIEVLVDDSRLKGRTYKVITTDYLANGGDNMSFFLSSLKVEKLNLKLRDAILEEMKDLSEKDKKITANLDKRIRYAN